MAEWLKGCEVCDAGLCARVDGLKEQGMSERKCFPVLEDDQKEQLGEVIYSKDALRARYRKIKGGWIPSTPNSELAGPGRKPKYQKPPEAWTCAMDMAGLAIGQLSRIPKDDPKRHEAFKKVIAWIEEQEA